MKETKAILFIDGYCHVCNALVSFIHKYDTENIFLFSSLQSEFASTLKAIESLEPSKVRSAILITPNGNIYTHSDAVIKSFELLGGIWSTFKIFKLIPKVARDFIYLSFAKIRFLFGRKDSCMLPEEKLSSKILK